jgi:hypothetical protein
MGKETVLMTHSYELRSYESYEKASTYQLREPEMIQSIGPDSSRY